MVSGVPGFQSEAAACSVACVRGDVLARLLPEKSTELGRLSLSKRDRITAERDSTDLTAALSDNLLGVC